MHRTDLARMIDHTLLAPTATPGQIAMFCGEATLLNVGAVCVSPNRLPLPVDALPTTTAVCTVIGFPSGAHRSAAKAAEAAQAVADGATELDMVIDLGLAMSGLWHAVEADIAAVRAQVPSPLLLKVIIESAALTDEQIVAVCRASADAGADFVKTSTGFHPAGGASAHAVELMRRTVGDALGVKASGGIRSWDAAVQMVEAGASRLGLSGTAAVLAGGSADGDY